MAGERNQGTGTARKSGEAYRRGTRQRGIALDLSTQPDGQEVAGEVRRQWLGLEIGALAQTGNGPRLLAIYDHAPKLFEIQVPAVLELCRALLRAKDLDRFDKLFAEWKGRQSSPGPWFDLEVDSMLSRGKVDDTVKVNEFVRICFRAGERLHPNVLKAPAKPSFAFFEKMAFVS